MLYWLPKIFLFSNWLFSKSFEFLFLRRRILTSTRWKTHPQRRKAWSFYQTKWHARKFTQITRLILCWIQVRTKMNSFFVVIKMMYPICKELSLQFFITGSSIKVMGYSTFRHFLKDQFPNVRFHKDDVKNSGESKLNHACSINVFHSQNT